MIKHYESTAVLRADYIRLGCVRYGGNEINSWYGNETSEQTLSRLEIGDTSLVPAAEAILSQLETGVETPRKTWERNVAGPFVCVPDVLAGLPTPMRRLAPIRDETAPISIFVDTGSSAAVSADMLRRRGTVALALVLAMSRIRPTTLYQLDVGSGPNDGTGESVLITKINTAPLDLATACYVLTSAGFARGVVYAVEQALNGNSGGWPKGFDFSNPTPYYTKLKQRLGLDPKHTLIIQASRSIDTMLKNPVAWINDQIKQFTVQQEEEYVV